MALFDFNSKKECQFLKIINSFPGNNENDNNLMEKLKCLDGCIIQMFADFLQITQITNDGFLGDSVLSSYITKEHEDDFSTIFYANFDSGLNKIHNNLPIKVALLKKKFEGSDLKIIAFGGRQEKSCNVYFHIINKLF